MNDIMYLKITYCIFQQYDINIRGNNILSVISAERLSLVQPRGAVSGPALCRRSIPKGVAECDDDPVNSDLGVEARGRAFANLLINSRIHFRTVSHPNIEFCCPKG